MDSLRKIIVVGVALAAFAAQAKDIPLKEFKYTFYGLAGSKTASIDCPPPAELAGTMVTGVDDTQDLSQIPSFTFSKDGQTDQKTMVQDGWMPVIEGRQILFEKTYHSVDKFEANANSVTFSFYPSGVENALRYGGAFGTKLEYTVTLNGCKVHQY